MRSKSKECDPIGTTLRPTGCEIGDYKLLIRNFLCENLYEKNLYEKNGRDDERESIVRDGRVKAAEWKLHSHQLCQTKTNRRMNLKPQSPKIKRSFAYLLPIAMASISTGRSGNEFGCTTEKRLENAISRGELRAEALETLIRAKWKWKIEFQCSSALCSLSIVVRERR